MTKFIFISCVFIIAVLGPWLLAVGVVCLVGDLCSFRPISNEVLLMLLTGTGMFGLTTWMKVHPMYRSIFVKGK